MLPLLTSNCNSGGKCSVYWATCGSVLTLWDRIFAGCVKTARTKLHEVVIKGVGIRGFALNVV